MNYDIDYLPVIKRLAATFPQRPIGPETVAAYWEMLHSMDGDVFNAAANYCATHAEWFPTLHAIFDAADTLLTDAGVFPPSPESAWGTILGLAQRWGDGSSISRHVSDETLIAAVGKVGGMMRIAMSDDYAVRAIEKDFLALYRPMRANAIRAQGLYSLGLPDAFKIGAGHDGALVLR